MLGAIAGDIIGSVYEALPIKTTDFPLFHPYCRFTDDTVLTVALAESLMNGAPFVGLLKQYYRAYPHVGFGGFFHRVGAVGGLTSLQQLGQRLSHAGQPCRVRLCHPGRRVVDRQSGVPR